YSTEHTPAILWNPKFLPDIQGPDSRVKRATKTPPQRMRQDRFPHQGPDRTRWLRGGPDRLSDARRDAVPNLQHSRTKPAWEDRPRKCSGWGSHRLNGAPR